jgi:hypothetical protein
MEIKWLYERLLVNAFTINDITGDHAIADVSKAILSAKY